MKTTKKYLLLFVIAITFASCKEDDPNIQNTEAVKFAGEWFVTYTLGGSDAGGGYTKIITSNTAANLPTEIMVTDYVDPNATSGNFWSYKAKATAIPASLEFNADKAESDVVVKGDPYSTTVTITNGKIFPKGGFSKTKVVVDSIYFEVVFGDDPGDKFICSGHKRTGFSEDEY